MTSTNIETPQSTLFADAMRRGLDRWNELKAEESRRIAAITEVAIFGGCQFPTDRAKRLRDVAGACNAAADTMETATEEFRQAYVQIREPVHEAFREAVRAVEAGPREDRFEIIAAGHPYIGCVYEAVLIDPQIDSHDRFIVGISTHVEDAGLEIDVEWRNVWTGHPVGRLFDVLVEADRLLDGEVVAGIRRWIERIDRVWMDSEMDAERALADRIERQRQRFG